MASKVCTICHQDCSNKPRTKDASGKYTCRACYDKAVAAAKAKAARPAPVAAAAAAGDVYDDDANFMASLLDDQGSSPPAPQMGSVACPNCGNGMASGAVICVACGYNKATGGNTNMAVAKAPRSSGAASGAGALAASAAGALGSGAAIILGSVIGAVIGGAVGAGIWAAICYNLNVEIGWIAWGVGILAGIGAAAGSRGHTGLFTGGIAVVVAIAAILAGKYITFDMVIGDVVREIQRETQITDENAIAMIARGVAQEKSSANTRITWPEDVNPEYAFEEADFPEFIWKDATGRWARLSHEERATYHDAALREHRRMLDQFTAEFKGEGFIHMFGVLDLLFFGLAIVSAAGIGAGGSIGGGSDD